jgi:hypothetical protein
LVVTPSAPEDLPNALLGMVIGVHDRCAVLDALHSPCDFLVPLGVGMSNILVEALKLGTDEGALLLAELVDLVEDLAHRGRVVIYLRWHHGDADDIAPSLWAGPMLPQDTLRFPRRPPSFPPPHRVPP